jgi:hypothetical protein
VGSRHHSQPLPVFLVALNELGGVILSDSSMLIHFRRRYIYFTFILKLMEKLAIPDMGIPTRDEVSK